jgi:hypothetical protein
MRGVGRRVMLVGGLGFGRFFWWRDWSGNRQAGDAADTTIGCWAKLAGRVAATCQQLAHCCCRRYRHCCGAWGRGGGGV